MRTCARVLVLGVALAGLASACDDHEKSSAPLVVIEATKPEGGRPTAQDMELSVAVIRDRLDSVGLGDVEVIRKGSRIMFRLPVRVDRRALPLLIRTGRLEIFDLQGDLAHPSIDALGFPRASLKRLSPRPKTVVVTCRKGARYCPGVPTRPTSNYYYLLKYDPKSKTHPVPELTGSDLKAKGTRQDVDTQTNEPIVLLQFTDKGARKFEALTRRLAERGRSVHNRIGGDDELTFQQFAIVLDRQLWSAPTIDYKQNPGGIPGENGAQITGIPSLREAKDLAIVLRAGTFPVEFRLVSK
ncbi:MAG TPA: hypothetical protein VK488_10680 [Gaiellaceae bacterium]|nr:hypothetical protein [Gaiellaceae bacterium]